MATSRLAQPSQRKQSWVAGKKKKKKKEKGERATYEENRVSPGDRHPSARLRRANERPLVAIDSSVFSAIRNARAAPNKACSSIAVPTNCATLSTDFCRGEKAPHPAHAPFKIPRRSFLLRGSSNTKVHPPPLAEL